MIYCKTIEGSSLKQKFTIYRKHLNSMDGDFSVEDKPRSGQPKKFEDKELESLLEED